MTERQRCKIEEDRSVTMCPAMGRTCETMSGKRGIQLLQFSNLRTGQNTRQIIVAKSGEHAKNGVVLNFCPFCAEPLYVEAAEAIPDPPKEEGK